MAYKKIFSKPFSIKSWNLCGREGSENLVYSNHDLQLRALLDFYICVPGNILS